jgi:NTE family protein
MAQPFRKLSLNSGGVKGILHIGALRQLKKYQELEFPDGVWGCSIGAIVGVCIAFRLPIDSIDIKKYLNFEKAIGKPNLRDVTNTFSSKGMFSMDTFETHLIEVYKHFGFDITSKKIGDAHMPLYIVASNITKGVPTVFSKDVSLMEALKCSCCLPGVFKPQELYGQLYVDGGLFVPDLSTLNSDGLHFFLTKQRTGPITPQTIQSISPIDYVTNLYSMTMNQFHNFYKAEFSVDLEYTKLNSISHLDNFDTEKVLRHSAKLLDNLLLSKGINQKSTESS